MKFIFPVSTYYSLPNLDDSTALHIHTHLREDAIQLFGFLSQSEKEAFLLLTSVTGVGPKLALSVLSSLSVTDLVHAIQTADTEKLETVPGIGKKSAGRSRSNSKIRSVRFKVSTPVLPRQSLRNSMISSRMRYPLWYTWATVLKMPKKP